MDKKQNETNADNLKMLTEPEWTKLVKEFRAANGFTRDVNYIIRCFDVSDSEEIQVSEYEEVRLGVYRYVLHACYLTTKPELRTQLVKLLDRVECDDVNDEVIELLKPYMTCRKQFEEQSAHWCSLFWAGTNESVLVYADYVEEFEDCYA